MVLLGIGTTSFPFAILSASLDKIRVDLDTSLATISWVQVAPALASGVAVPVFGKLSDRWGGRRVFLTGTLLTVVLSILTACAWDAYSLIAIRTLGQAAGAATGPAGFTVVAHCFGGGERARAIGRVGAVTAIAPILGVALGGLMIESVGWQAIFVAQAVPAAIAAFLALRILPETARGPVVPFDYAGSALLAAAVATGLFALNRLRPWGITHPFVLACFAVAVLLGAAFASCERRSAFPLAPLHYLRRRDFSAAILTLGLILVVFQGASIVTPLLLHRQYGYSFTAIAYLVAIRPLGYSLGCWMAPVLRSRVGALRTQATAAVALTVGGLPLVYAAGHRNLPVLVGGFVLVGLAGGTSYTTVLTTVNEIVEVGDVGIANGIASMTTTIGGATGVTLLSAIVGDSELAGPFVTGFWVLAATSVLTLFSTAVGVARFARPATPGSTLAPEVDG